MGGGEGVGEVGNRRRAVIESINRCRPNRFGHGIDRKETDPALFCPFGFFPEFLTTRLPCDAYLHLHATPPCPVTKHTNDQVQAERPS